MSESDLTTGECQHLAHILEGGGSTATSEFLTKYKTLITWNAYRTQKAVYPAKRRKIAVPTCGTCNLALPRPFACMHCQFIGCWSNDHIYKHLIESGHNFATDVSSGTPFCSNCDDFVYNAKLDNIHLTTILASEERHTKFQVTKKSREPFHCWTPNSKEESALNGVVVIPCQGRRGLLNLGQTCFMNAVLQCFAHNPLLRNYFLSDKHNWKLCKASNCTCCEMDKFFSEVYSSDTTPFGPTSFLTTFWRASAELSGYAQRDAHEFFIAALNQIHATSRGSTNVSCNCIIHSTFAGQLQSDVKCERCGNVNTTVDPMLDISLELKGKYGDTVSGENTLAGCLRRFTQPEKLSPKEYTCVKCGKTPHEASKRLSIRKLPPVLSFQFKRFEHKSSDKSTARKIDTPTRFPASLNMAQFTTLTMREGEKDNSGPVFSYPGPGAMYEYDLFAVINHEGQIDNGHYTNFARYQDEWYRFDDDKYMRFSCLSVKDTLCKSIAFDRVTHSSLGACLDSPAYMCFYVKRHLDYKPYMTPSYVLTRETEAVREKEMEKEKEAARMKEVEDALLATV